MAIFIIYIFLLHVLQSVSQSMVTRKHFTMKLNLLPHVNVEDWKRCFSFYPTFHTFCFPFPLLLLCQITISWPCLTCHVVKNIQHVINFQLAMPRLSRGLVIIIPWNRQYCSFASSCRSYIIFEFLQLIGPAL